MIVGQYVLEREEISELLDYCVANHGALRVFTVNGENAASAEDAHTISTFKSYSEEPATRTSRIIIEGIFDRLLGPSRRVGHERVWEI